MDETIIECHCLQCLVQMANNAAKSIESVSDTERGGGCGGEWKVVERDGR